MSYCQACRKNPIEVIDKCDNPNYPYRVCNACHRRLLTRSLRPREYFYLAAAHGITFLLHDDFYDNKGAAFQPEEEVEDDPALSFPQLGELKDLPSLMDYAIVQVRDVTDEVVNAIKAFGRKEILAGLDKRLASNRSLLPPVCDIVALALGPYADEWVVQQWRLHTSKDFPYYAEMLAKCLDEELGFALYSAALAEVQQPSELSSTMTGLIYFQSRLGLDWIKKNITRVTNISEAWGYVAVASRFDWTTASKWLAAGRPLSLIALDALANCAVTAETKNSILWLKDNPQRLKAPAAIEEMNEVLRQYGEKDRVARVRTKIGYIMDNWEKILKP